MLYGKQNLENMDNKVIVFFAYICTLIGIASCSDGSKTSSDSIKPVVSCENEILNVTSLDEKEHNIKIYIEKKEVVNKSYSDVYKASIPTIFKGYGSNYEIALMAISGISTGIALNIKIDDVIDTIVYATIEPLETKKCTSSIRGNCARLISAESNPEQEVNIKKWLFRKNKQLEQYQIDQMKGILAKINSNGTSDYVTNGTIPVLKNFAGVSYQVSSEMKADHYILYASSSDKEIKDFVEEIVANDFELTSKSLGTSMNCYRKMDSDGYKCITLIGINDDWSYNVEPLGLVAIDNTPPRQLSTPSQGINQILLKGNKRVVIPKSKPMIDGMAYVSVLDWDGNGLECNVTFNVLFSGDAKSITVVRNKKLCYPGEHRIENKVVNLSDKDSPYMFTYTLHFEGGNNIIPIIVEDYHGNRNEYTINVPARFTRNTPDVQIDNNINVW